MSYTQLNKYPRIAEHECATGDDAFSDDLVPVTNRATIQLAQKYYLRGIFPFQRFRHFACVYIPLLLLATGLLISGRDYYYFWGLWGVVMAGAATAWEAYWVRRAAEVLVGVGVVGEGEERHYAEVIETAFEEYLGEEGGGG